MLHFADVGVLRRRGVCILSYLLGRASCQQNYRSLSRPHLWLPRFVVLPACFYLLYYVPVATVVILTRALLRRYLRLLT